MKRVLSLFVLVAALITIGGVAVASIPDSSGVIHGCRKNSDGSLRVIDSDAGQTCPNGWTALNWSQTGPQGPAGTNGVSGYEVIRVGPFSFSGQDTQFVDALCPTGKKATGGGFTVSFAPVKLVESRPLTTNFDSKEGWRVVVQGVSFDSYGPIYTWAICAAVG